jgi:ATP-dependent DNA helicase RecQ
MNSKIRIYKEAYEIRVSFQYDPFLVNKIKSIGEHKWHSEGKYWSFPNSNDILDEILRAFKGKEIYLDDELVEPEDDIVSSFEVNQAERINADPPPKILIARTRFQNYQVRFFETVAVSEGLLEKIRLEECNEETLKAFSQWRVDYPIKNDSLLLDEPVQLVLSVLEKILTRGRVTLTSPKLEEEFGNIFIKKSAPSLTSIEKIAVNVYKNDVNSFWLDSKEEVLFFENVLPELLGENFCQFVLPQVQISSLIFANSNLDTTKYQRVDFAIFHPKTEEKLVIEIDGQQHQQHLQSDQERDKILTQYGYKVVRIPAKLLKSKENIDIGAIDEYLDIRDFFSTINANDNFNSQELSSYGEEEKFVLSIKIAHQIQIVLFQAIQSGFLDLFNTKEWQIISDLDKIDVFSKKEANEILQKAIDDFLELVGRLFKLYSIKFDIEKPSCLISPKYKSEQKHNKIYISFYDEDVEDFPVFYVQNIYFPYHITNYSFSSPPAVKLLNKPSEKELEYFLNYLFRKLSFWEGQYDGISRALQGEDLLILLPTGAGKSLVYQLASMLLPGRTIVIDPIISLMNDQIDNLSNIGIDRCVAITSEITDPNIRSKLVEIFGQGEYLFTFIAPERFQMEDFRNSLRTLTVNFPVALIVVDEAHCVSEWGHDFRTSYLNIGRTSREYCKSQDKMPPLIALTGTASRSVLKDVERELQINDTDAVITPKTFDRKELKYEIINATSDEKIARLKGYLSQKLPTLFKLSPTTFFQPRGKETFSGIIFCPHINGDFGVEKVAEEIRQSLGIPVSTFSGGEPRHMNHEDFVIRRHQITKDFKYNKAPLLVATKAFGMGIDKPNVRYTIHYNISPSIEAFYQEAGRAGRDKKNAYSCIIVSNDDPERNLQLLDPNSEIEEIKQSINNIKRSEEDDITRVLFFHTNSFRGITEEKENVLAVLNQIGDTSKKSERVIQIPRKIKEKEKEKENKYKKAREIMEKALHRLLLIGVISDYTIDYSKDEFKVSITGYTKDQVIESYRNYIKSYQVLSEKLLEVEKASELKNLPIDKFILSIIELLLDFIYGIIERGRRRALLEMIEVCNLKSDKEIRSRILQYLEATEYTEYLEKLVDSQDFGYQVCKEIIESIPSPNEAAKVRGQVSRYLESYPDHPSLLMLRALSEIIAKEKNYSVVKQNFFASSKSIFRYKINNTDLLDFLAWSISIISNYNLQLGKELTEEVLKAFYKIEYIRELVKHLPENLKYIPASVLLAQLSDRCETLITNLGG